MDAVRGWNPLNCFSFLRDYTKLSPLVGALSYFAWANLFLIGYYQRESSEVGGAAQAFLSAASLPLGLVVGYIYFFGVARPVFKLLTNRGCLNAASILISPFLLFLVVTNIVAVGIALVSSEESYTLETLFEISRGVVLHAVVPFSFASLAYLFFSRKPAGIGITQRHR